MKQEVLLYQVYSNTFSLSTDIPFKNGKYTHGEDDEYPAFSSLSRSSIQSDSSFFHHIFLILSFIKSQKPNYLTFKRITVPYSFFLTNKHIHLNEL